MPKFLRQQHVFYDISTLNHLQFGYCVANKLIVINRGSFRYIIRYLLQHNNDNHTCSIYSLTCRASYVPKQVV